MFKEGDRVLKGNERCVIIKVLKRDKEWYRCYISLHVLHSEKKKLFLDVLRMFNKINIVI